MIERCETLLKNVKSKIIKTKETDTKKNVKSERSLLSRFTSHISHSLVTFFNHVSHSLSHSFIHIACLAFLIFIIYSNTFSAPFQWDESSFIVDNPIIKDLHYFANPSDAKGFELYSALINRYVGFLTFALNYRIDGLSVTGYHIVNIAIHIANSVLVYFLVLLTFRTPFFKTVNGEWIKTEKAKLKDVPFTIHDSPFTIHGLFSVSHSLIAFFSAAIFAVHPIQTEAVTYVFQRLASLVAFFYLLSLTAYIQSRLSEGRRQRFFYYSIAFISAVLAMKTKENAFTLPIVITLYEFCFFSLSTTHSSRSSSPFTIHHSRFLYLAPILLTIVIIPLTLISLSGAHQIDPGAYGAKELSQSDYLFTQFRVIVTYLRLLFFPVNQNLDYDYPVFKSFFDPQVILSFAFLTALIGLAVYFIRYSRFTINDSRPFRLMGFGILWFFITLSVESSIIPLPMLINEYRVYLPSIGLIICAVTGFFLVFSRFTSHVSHSSSRFTAFKRFTVVLLILITGVLSVATYLRNDLWADSIKLWEDTAEKSPAKARVHFCLADIYQARNMPDEAIEQYLIAIKLKPDYADAHNNLGFTYQARNMPDEAIEQYLTAIKLKPDYAEVHINLGNIYQARNMPSQAIEQYLTAIKLKPGLAEAHYDLGVIYLSLNMPDKAIEHYLIAIKLKPDYLEAHYNLGAIYQARNMPDKAIEHFLIAVKLKPDSAEAHYNLGAIYQAHNMPDKAVNEFQTVANLKPNVAEAHFSLGLLYYNLGQMENARRELIIGLKIKPDDQKAQQLLKNVN